MKKINEYPLEDITLDILPEEIGNVVKGTYSIYVNLRNGNVNIAKSSRPKKTEFVIGKVSLADDSKKKFIKEFYCKVRRIIRQYHSSGSLICKTTAIKEFGKEFVSKFDPVLVLRNPYYSRGNPMCLYDINVLRYNKAV